MLRCALPAAAALAALTLTTPALAGTPFTLSTTGEAPDISVHPDTGTATVVWTEPGDVHRTCQVLRGGTACAAPPVTLDMGEKVGPPYLVRDPADAQKLYAFKGRYVGGDAWAAVSTDGGATFAPGKRIYKGGSNLNGTGDSRPVLHDGELVEATWNGGGNVYGAKLDLSESAGERPVASLGGGDKFDLALAKLPDGGLAAVSNDLGKARFWRAAPGTDPSATATWSAPADLGPTGRTQVVSGKSGTFLFAVSQGVRKWDGTTFGAPVAVQPTAKDATDFKQGPSGSLNLLHKDDFPDEIVLERSTDGGASFTTRVIARDTRSTDSPMRLDLAADDGGFAVWLERSGTGIRMADLTEAPAPPKPPATTPTTTTAPTQGTGRPPATITPTPPPVTQTPTGSQPLSKTTQLTVLGGRFTVSWPGGRGACVPRGVRQRIGVVFTRGRGTAKLRRVTITLRGRTVVRDDSGPFLTFVRLPATAVRGSVLPYRVTGSFVRRGRTTTTTIAAPIRVC